MRKKPTGRRSRCARVSAAAITMMFAGCTYFAQAPEIAPNRYAPPQPNETWSPPTKTASEFVAPAGDRAPAHVPIAPAEASVRTYDLPQLIDVSLTNNPGTRQAWERARAAAAAYGASRAPYYPKLSTQTRAGYTRQIVELPGQVGAFKQWESEPVLRLTYTLIDFGRRDADDEIAREQLAASNFSFNRELQTVVFATQQAFYALAAAKAGVTAAEQNLELARTDDDAVQKRVDLGLATQPELLLARERVAQSEFDLANAQLLVHEGQASMALAIGVAANAPFDVESLERQPVPKTLGAQVDELIARAVRARPDLASQVASLNASQAGITRARAEFYPYVTGLAEYGEQTWNFRFVSPPSITTNQPQYTAGFSLNWDIFTGFQRLNNLKQAKANTAEAAATLQSSELAAIADVWRAYYEFESTLKKYAYAEALLAATQEAYNANLDTYRQGLSTIVELLTADRDLANARYTMIQSTADLLTSSAAVAYAVGAIEMPRHH
ncbi:MAG TPA: TolC family protein [Candidatus Binataceae bacterium]|nr:TolC family protein [Candidatus Binataceae bacterium]